MNYLLPDMTCDFSFVHIKDSLEHLVGVSGGTEWYFQTDSVEGIPDSYRI